MSLLEQLEFCQELEKLFLDKDKQFSQYADYDGSYREYADKMGEVIESIWRLSDLEK